MRRPVGLPALIAFVGVAGIAHADDLTEARELFQRGRDLVKAGNHEEACPLFEQSLELEAALGTELNLALCFAEVGRLLDAQKLFESVAMKTEAPDQVKRHELAVQAISDLSTRIPKLTIKLPGDTTTVRVDGRAYDASEPIAVDPGKHEIEADGMQSRTIEIGEGETSEVKLAPPASPKEPEPTPEPMPPPAVRSKLPLQLGIAGGALIVGSVVTGLFVVSKRDNGLEQCMGTPDSLVCTPAGADALAGARTLSHVATGFAITGAILVGAAVVLRLRDKGDQPPAVSAWVGNTAGGIAWGGQW
jgi:hypothetical protein